MKSIEKNANRADTPFLRIEEDSINRISNDLDPESKAIVSYIWQNRYATIDELASLCGSSNHMHILLKIKEVINPLAEKIIGYPLLVFEKLKIDSGSGHKILFSWWLTGGESVRLKKGTFLDIFDEGDYIRIILEVFGVSLENIRFKVRRDKLFISSDSPEKIFQEEVLLPAHVISKGLSKRYKNGILEVRLQKLQK